MASFKPERITACLKSSTDTKFHSAKFSLCLLDSLGFDPKSQSAEVYFKTDGKCLNLSTRNEGNLWKRGVLRHPEDCPARRLTDEERFNLSSKSRGVDVGSNIVIQTSDDYIFLTRRNLKMKTFPGVWVPPGGHLDPGESLEQAALRELQEETGLNFHHLIDQLIVLGLWESLYPPFIIPGMMEPRRHHVISYFYLPVAMSKDALQAKLKLNSAEVAMAAWFPKSLANFLGSLKYSEFKGFPVPKLMVPPELPTEIPAVEIDQETGQIKSTVLDTNLIFENIHVFSTSEDSHRISLGTFFALSRLKDCFSSHI